MKTILIIIGLALGVSAIMLFAMPERRTSHTILLFDETEELGVKPKADQVIRSFGLDVNKWNGARLGIEPVTDVSFNQVTECLLPEGESILFSNTFDRDREVQTFINSVTTAVDSLADDTIGRTHSSVYIPMARALNTLASSTATPGRKTLIVFSDLRENRSTLSFYDKHTLALLHEDASKIEVQLLGDAQLPDLSGITIYFVHQPKDEEADTNFRLISNFYSHMFSSRGARVIVGANFNP